MNRLISLITLIILSVATLSAKAPDLAVEKLFDGRFSDEKNVSISIHKSNGDFFRGMTVTNNPTIVQAIAKAINKDAANASNYFEHKNDDGHFTALTIVNHGDTIQIGFKRDNFHGAFLFIQGKEKAFK